MLGGWLALGLDRLAHRLESIDLRRDRVEVVHRVSGRRRWDDALHRQVYRLVDDDLVIENEVLVGPDLRDLPRVGVLLTVPAGLERLEWFGRGPWDNYSDRKASAVVGRFASTVRRPVRSLHPPSGARSQERRAPALARRSHRVRCSRCAAGLRSASRRAISRRATSTARGTPATSSRAPRSTSASITRSAVSVPRAAGPIRIRGIGCSSRRTGSRTRYGSRREEPRADGLRRGGSPSWSGTRY